MFSALRQFLQRFVGLLPSAVSAAEKAQKPAHPLRPWLHVLAVVALCVGLYWISWKTGLGRDVLGAGDFWLPVLVLLVYAFVWVAYWLWKVWTSEEEEDYFEDIARTWEQAVQALERNGLYLKNLPLFLILGEPASGEPALFRASGLTLRLDRSPGEESPLHIYATQQAIYLCCPGLSLLAHQTRYLSKTMTESERDDWVPQETQTGTLPPNEPSLRELQQIFLTVTREGREYTEEERHRIAELDQRSRPYRSFKPRKAEECSRRLRYLCRLVVHHRDPLCPANGILVLLPFEGLSEPGGQTPPGQVAADTAVLCKRDLEAVRQGLQMLCPRVVLIADLERAPGFREFLSGFTREDRRQSRIGQRLPLNPDLAQSRLSPQELMGGSLADWINRENLPGFLDRVFALEDRPENLGACLDKNTRTFYLLDQLHQRTSNLGTLLYRGLVENAPPPLLIRGCYYAATGSDSESQAFVRKALELLTEHQSDLRWTDEVLQQEARYHNLANLFTAAAVILGLVLVGVVVLVVFNFGRLVG